MQGLFDDAAAGARERGRLSEQESVCHVELAQEDGREGMVARRAAAGGHRNSGKTRAMLHGRFTHAQAIFEDGSGAGNGSF